MSTKTAEPIAINWNKVLRVTFRFAFAIAVLAFKLVLIALSFIIGLITAGGDSEDKKSSDVGFADSFEAENDIYTHSDNYNIASRDISRS
jgi:hypothetical protein